MGTRGDIANGAVGGWVFFGVGCFCVGVGGCFGGWSFGWVWWVGVGGASFLRGGLFGLLFPHGTRLVPRGRRARNTKRENSEPSGGRVREERKASACPRARGPGLDRLVTQEKEASQKRNSRLKKTQSRLDGMGFLQHTRKGQGEKRTQTVSRTREKTGAVA